ncbi:MAG: hypothetical protein ACO1TE_23640 [Prosthecobacter sp.]
MLRKSGAQLYHLTKAHWRIDTHEEYGVAVISLGMQAENLPSIFPEDDAWPHGPEWILAIWAPNLGPETLQPGTTVAIPSEWDEPSGHVFTNFFYDEHDHTSHNLITVVSRSADAIRVTVEGQISAENASMVPTRMIAEATFTPGQEPAGLSRFMRTNPPPQPPHGAVVRHSTPRP